MSVDLLPEAEPDVAILSGVNIRRQFVGDRDWSKHPNAWKLRLAFASGCLVLGVAFLIGGDLLGLGYLVFALIYGLVARYTFLAARPARSDPRLGESDGELH